MAGPNAVLVYSGTPGEALSLGQAGVATSDAYNVSTSEVNGHPETFMLNLTSKAPAPQPFPRAFVIFLTPIAGNTLAVGFYDNVANFVGGPRSSPTMSASIGGISCGSEFQGSFEIFNIALNGNGSVQRIHGKVVQRCLKDPPGTALTLEFWYPSKGSF